MNRRHLIQASTTVGLTPIMRHTSALDVASPAASPEVSPADDDVVDTRARQLVDQLDRIPPLTLLEALETARITDPLLKEAAPEAEPRPWNDPSDTDLDHALGGVLIVANDEPINSPDLDSLGAFIVFESAGIAYHELMRRMEHIDSGMSTSVAGIKMWVVQADDMQLGMTRLGNVLVIATMSGPGNVPEGMIMHLDAVARSLS